MSLYDDTAHMVWIERYRPKTLDEYICSDKTKHEIEAWIHRGDNSHLILESAPPGTGKTTLALIVAHETVGEENTLPINCSLHNGIDTIREEVIDFCSYESIGGEGKVVILDESDKFSDRATDALKGILEEYHETVRFIFTCNNLSKISGPLQDRCEIIDFTAIHGQPESKERQEVGMRMLELCCRILKENDVEYEEEVVFQVIKNNFRSCMRFRSIIRTLYKHSKNGPITMHLMKDLMVNLSELPPLLKSGSGPGITDYAHHNHVKWRQIYEELYENADQYFNQKSPNFVPALDTIEIYSQKMLTAPIPALTFQMSLFRIVGLQVMR